MQFRRHKVFISVSIITCFFSILSYAEEDYYFSEPFQDAQFETSQMDFGGIGLMQMPSARMADEGDLSFGYTRNDEYQFYSLSLQLMPWFESVIRYTQVNDVLYSSSESFSGDTSYTDKGIDTKIRLWKESQYLPDLSVGLRDIGGTGLFDGEFVAATKHFSTDHYGDFDFTLGLGWGYLGTRGNLTNPICSLVEHFCSRVTEYSGNGGNIDYDRWFTGSASLFGGIEYQTPYKPLRLKLEYDGNDYSNDYPVIYGGVDITPSSPWNFGAVYAINDAVDFRLSYERGTTFTLGFSVSGDLNKLPSTIIDEPFSYEGLPQTTLDGVNWKKLDKELYSASGYQVKQLHIENKQVSITSTQDKYRDRAHAVERASAVLASHLPKGIEAYEIIEESNHLPLTSTIVSAEAYRRFANVEYINPKIEDAIVKGEAIYVNEDADYEHSDPFNISLHPNLSQSFGNPESFYIYNLSLKSEASYWLNNKLQLSGVASLNLINNYDELNYVVPSDGTSNYRVRTLIRAYVQESEVALSNLQLTWFQKYGSNWYQQFYIGYLERMFAGFGSELLYRPLNSNWAIGVDVNGISQRDPSSLLNVFNNELDYSDDTKVLAQGSTGHLSIYYQPKWSILEDTLFQIDIGKFLATDKGVRLDFSKQYKSGVIVGAFLSKTDLSAEEFGEGSFTKGFYLSIPFDALSLKPTTRRVKTSWQPLLRDGGQKLSKHNNLFEITDSLSPWFQRPNQN